MNRRTLMAGLSGAALPILVRAASPVALAQTSTAAPLGLLEYRRMTLLVGSLAKQTSELALQRRTHPRIHEFAAFENAEQTTMAQVLTDTPNPPAVPLDAAQEGMLRQLQATSGPAFDRAYVQMQLQGQPSMATDPVHVAMMARTTIQMHLTMLQDIDRMLSTNVASGTY